MEPFLTSPLYPQPNQFRIVDNFSYKVLHNSNLICTFVSHIEEAIALNIRFKPRVLHVTAPDDASSSDGAFSI